MMSTEVPAPKHVMDDASEVILYNRLSRASVSDDADSIEGSSSVQSSDTNDDVLLDNYFAGTRPRSRSLYNSMRPLVYITRRVPQHSLDVLLPTCNISQWDSEEGVPRGELLHSVEGFSGILCMPSDVINEEVLNAAGPNLRVVATMSVTTNHIDVKECARRNIRVLCCPPQDLDAQADLTVALIFLTIRQAAEATSPLDNCVPNKPHDLFNQIKDKSNDASLALESNLITDKRFGVYGLTTLGLSVAVRLRQLGVNDVIMADFRPDAPSLAELKEQLDLQIDDNSFTDFQVVTREQFLASADVVCLCSSNTTPQSYAIFDKEAFHNMKKGAILVNSDSGHVLDYTALYVALRDGEICAAGLNACNQTPVPFKYPLQGLSNCIFMPQTEESGYDIRHQIAVMMAKEMLKVLNETFGNL